MAKVAFVDISPELESAFWSGLQPGDRFMYSRIRRKEVFFSRKRKKGLSQRSLLPQVSVLWNALTELQKDAWSVAGAFSNLNGYRLFVQDTCARIINEIEGVAVPSVLHQSWVGNLHIGNPATELKIIQQHPHFYYVSQKVVGKKSMYNPVKINEDFALPLSISLNYKTNLSSVGPGSFAKFYAKVWHSYQGLDRFTLLSINLDLSTDWKNDTIELENVLGYIVRYDLYFDLYNVQGDVYFDNVKAVHSGQNWCRDTFCKDINQGFTRAFYQVPKHWAGVNVPDGSYFESVYL